MLTYFISLVLSFTIISSSYSAEDDRFSEPVAHRSYLSEALCNTAARLYYATSVTGYDTYPAPYSEFCKNYFQEWKSNSFDIQVKDELEIEKTLRFFGIRYKSDSNYFIKEKKSFSRSKSINFSYIFNQSDVAVNVIPLCSNSITTSDLTQEGTHQFQEPHATFSTEHPSSLLFMQHLFEEFKSKEIIIHTVLHSRADVSQTWISFLGDTSGFLEHYCYVKINVSQDHGKLVVQITDPMLEKLDQLLSSTTPKKSKDFFERMAKDLNVNLTYNYRYNGDQVLNLHDCGRFSSIYLLNGIKGVEPSALTATDVYLGFKELEKKGYETYHQTAHSATQSGPVCKPSMFSQFCGLRRIPVDLFLTWMGKSTK